MGLKVSAPITVANLACGFDQLGLALDPICDQIIIRKTDSKGLKISKITGAKLPYEPTQNTAGVAILNYLEHIQAVGTGLEIEIHKKVKGGSGLGSSASSAAAAVVAVNAILKKPLSKRELLPFAIQGEQVADGAYHADNVGPALLGGIVLIRDNKTHDVFKLPAPKGLYVTIIHPQIAVLTKDARSILKTDISLDQHIEQSGNLAATIHALYTSDLALLSRSIKDCIIEPQRAQLITGFNQIKQIAIDKGAIACSISGAGPSIFAISTNSLTAERIGVAMEKYYSDIKLACNLYISGINKTGAKIE